MSNTWTGIKATNTNTDNLLPFLLCPESNERNEPPGKQLTGPVSPAWHKGEDRWVCGHEWLFA